ncbi:CAP domain-containing protein [Neoroseomonas rubea]|uniref:CAP domain-containing protein n=1 Tax=Neoroseomonas rubea TaxID=2748666 RepID=UPI0018DF67F2|nr:CAP domain-containing protein [Roseomonas rubea]
MLPRRLLPALLPPLILGREALAADPGTQQAVRAEVNAARAAFGRGPLGIDDRLSRAATAHARDMLATSRMDHRGSDGSDPGARIARAGYRWRSFRENVAAGQGSPREVVVTWMNSPGHRANILADDVTQIGVGFAGGPGMMFGNVPRLFWTLVLAAPR